MAWTLPEFAWTDVRDCLFTTLRRPADPRAAGDRAPLARPIAPFLRERLAVEGALERRFVTARHLARWGVGADDAYAIGRANLAANLPSLTQGRAGLRCEGAHAAALVGVPGWLAAFDGPFLLALPSPDAVWVLPAEDPARAEWAASLREATLSPAIYTPDLAPWPGAWLAHAELAGACYAAQADALLELGVSADLPPFRIVRRGAEAWTETRWDGAAEAWLPEVDRVALPGGAVPWAAIATRLAPVPGADPPRWQIRP